MPSGVDGLSGFVNRCPPKGISEIQSESIEDSAARLGQLLNVPTNDVLKAIGMFYVDRGPQDDLPYLWNSNVAATTDIFGSTFNNNHLQPKLRNGMFRILVQPTAAYTPKLKLKIIKPDGSSQLITLNNNTALTASAGFSVDLPVFSIFQYDFQVDVAGTFDVFFITEITP